MTASFSFHSRVAAQVESDGRSGVVTEVEGMAYRTGTHSFTFDARDPIGPGFVLR